MLSGASISAMARLVARRLLAITQVREFGTNGMLVEVMNGPPGSLFPYVRRLIPKTYWPDLDARDSDRLPCIRAAR